MEELQVPIRKIHVEIVMDSGDCLCGSLYAPEFHYTAGRFECVLQILNDERFFLPFDEQGVERRGMIFNKERIVRVRLDAPVSECAEGSAGDELPIVADTCTLLLSDGTSLLGRLALETRWSASRLLDKLNLAPRFLPFVTDHGIEFIQRNHLVRAT